MPIAQATNTSNYLDKSYEEQYNGEQIQKTRLYMGDAILTEHYNQGSIDHYSIGFVFRDRLGSVVTIVDGNGDITNNKSYDAFRKPRKGSMEGTQTTFLSGIIAAKQQAGNNYTLQTNRGFTDHENLDDSQLIHMNGRVYDYNLGRFLSVDPFIQDPGNSQSLNPYSYIMNNPLVGVDPSGYVSIVAASFDCNEFNCGAILSGSVQKLAVDNGGEDNQGTKGKSEKKAENVGSKPLDLTDPGQVEREGSDRYYAKRESGGTEVGSGTSQSGSGDAEFDEAAQNLDLSNYLTAGFRLPQNENSDDSWSFGDPLPQGLVDGVTGFGDGVFNAITFGYGDLNDIRSAFGINGGVDKNSDLYSGGHLAGAINGGAALGGAIGLLGKGVKGFEYSHFVPQRFLNKFGITRKWKSPLNGTYVPKLFHALTDKFRYRFMPRTFKAQYGLTSPIPQGAQQVLRTPPVFVGGALGATSAR
ncbi:MAG: RHS repeat domain-containing protein [bacterium]